MCTRCSVFPDTYEPVGLIPALRAFRPCLTSSGIKRLISRAIRVVWPSFLAIFLLEIRLRLAESLSPTGS